MAGDEIEINGAHLVAGGESCGHAAASARKAAERLTSAKVESGMFGRSAEAESFHAKLSSAHQSHLERLEGHHAVLTGLSEQAGLAARAFGDTDDSAADDLGAAGDEFA